MPPSVAVLLPNYAGRELLERYLPSVVAAAATVEAPVVIVDDASPDDSVAFLNSTFPSVRVLALAENVGFARAVNHGVGEIPADTIVLLNTDVEPDPGFVPPLLRALEEPEVFAAVPRLRRPLEGGVAESAIAGEFRRGLFRLHFLGDEPFACHATPSPTLYPVGAAVAFRRDVFLRLGGLDPLYRPYYWEDADLGYRAWKAGYQVLCVPDSLADHHAGVIRATQPGGRIALAQDAHRFLFTWKNVHDPWWTLSHCALLGPHVLASLCTGRWGFVRGLIAALGRLPEALRARQAARRAATVSDREVLAQLG
ncbi:MAG: glycosyltransferase family 2 protein [Armatimonadetes bacterium]|nr:glycosyltransferase family 2 protein [Armatimonadota bacterium]